MKKTLITLLVVGAASISSCKKDELSTPDIKQQINGVDSKILCRNCGGGWELTDPSLSIESTITDSTPGTDTAFVNSKRFKDGAPVLPTNPKEK